ncbi:OsmC family protein [Aestuariispira insulae]|uniref:Putative redox protein n=1 Tax=Aestuariispira insulae TaxID=1461337 RepID=A0A3D9HWZ2_9PROT|nr:OsmC family protein [Aestuariispira insulae]RED54018.1 putative redox protein [Aestuariispira insulae]
MKTRVQWIDNNRWLANNESGHGLVLDASMGEGDPLGRLGPSPMELLLMGVGGCSGIDVIHILKKSREPVTDCVVEIVGTRADTDPKVFTDIHMIYTVTGKGLTPAKVERAVDLSKEKYCSASVMMGKAAKITREIKILEAGE